MEQLGAEAGGRERAAEPNDERDHAHALGHGCSTAALQCLGTEGGETDEARRAGGLRTRHQRAMPLELEEILTSSGEASAPTAQELAADAGPAGDLALGLTALHGRDGLADQDH